MSENSTTLPSNESTSPQQELIDKVISDPEVLEGVLNAPSVQMVITQQYSGLFLNQKIWQNIIR